MRRDPRTSTSSGVPIDLALSPDGRFVAFAVKAVAPNKDGYRTSLWVVAADGSAPARQITVGSKTDSSPRWSPDGRTIGFLSDRGAVLQAGGGGQRPGKAEAPKLGATQVWLLPFADGGEARQLTSLPRDVEAIAWSPDARRLCVVSASTRSDAPRKPSAPRARLRSPTRGSSIVFATSTTASGSSTIGSRTSG